jgi:hypothetical protein
MMSRNGARMTPEQFDERFRMLRRVTESHDHKQQAALVSNLRKKPTTLNIQSQNLQVRAIDLKQQLLQQLGVDPANTETDQQAPKRASIPSRLIGPQGNKAGSAAEC